MIKNLNLISQNKNSQNRSLKPTCTKKINQKMLKIDVIDRIV